MNDEQLAELRQHVVKQWHRFEWHPQMMVSLIDLVQRYKAALEEIKRDTDWAWKPFYGTCSGACQGEAGDLWNIASKALEGG